MSSRSEVFKAETVSKILDALRSGRSVRESCDAANIATTTYYRWLDRTGPGYSEFRAAAADAIRVGAQARLDEILSRLSDTK